MSAACNHPDDEHDPDADIKNAKNEATIRSSSDMSDVQVSSVRQEPTTRCETTIKQRESFLYILLGVLAVPHY